jgi:hypothetical protein
MVSASRAAMGEPFQPTRVLLPGGVTQLRDEAAPGCGCLVDDRDGGHIGRAVVLNPNQEWVGQERVALLYENLMYVGVPTVWHEDEFPRVAVGNIQSMWWVRTTLEPGWYDNQGTRQEYEVNPQWLDDGVEVMPLSVVNGSRLIGRMARRRRADGHCSPIGEPVITDRGEEIDWWVVNSFIVPLPQHRSSLPPAAPAEFIDTTVELTHEQKIARLNERFSALTQATISKAKDEDWCENYEEASERMGLAEEDYTRASDEPTSFEVTIDLNYSLGASALDRILNSEFGGDHNILDDVTVESRITVTVTQNSNDFDRNLHDWGDILDSAGYTGYDDYDITDWSSDI